MNLFELERFLAMLEKTGFWGFLSNVHTVLSLIIVLLMIHDHLSS